jgi:cysteine desulfurase/selenocysteine lyase
MNEGRVSGRGDGARNAPALDVDRVRGDFPILGRTIRGRRLVYLDNAATTQKPRAVIEAVSRFYEEENSNVHRGVHWLSQRATEAYESARSKVAGFLNAGAAEEVVFVRGATEAINLVARSYLAPRLRPDDEILVTAMEHHSNIVPWQMLCSETGAILRVAPMDDNGELLVEEFDALLGPRTRMAAVVHQSNALGTVNPVKRIIRAAHERGVPVLLDGAQAAAHLPVDVRDLDCDFYALSGHKVYGPTGIGALYGKGSLLAQMPPYQGGGDMILSVSFEKTVFNKPPFRFEAGTPDIAGAIGFGAALDYLEGVGRAAIEAHEADLLAYGTQGLRSIPGLRLIGTAREKASVLSFVLEGIHPHDAGTVLDEEGIAVRTGHHCAQPVMERLDIPATIRASVAFYNTREEMDLLVEGILKTIRVFSP